MKIIFFTTLFTIIFYLCFSIYLLFLESGRRSLTRKILIAGVLGIVLVILPVVFAETGVAVNYFIQYSILIFIVWVFLFTAFFHLYQNTHTSKTKNISETQNTETDKKNSNVIANWSDSVLNIVEERREKRERRNQDRRKDGSYVKLDNENSEEAPTIEISWHGIFSENIHQYLNKNLLIPKNIFQEFHILIFQRKTKTILDYRIPKPMLKSLPRLSLDFTGVQFGYGDKIIIYSKNITSLLNNEKKSYSEDRIKLFLQKNYKLEVKEFASEFAEELQDWSENLNENEKTAFSVIEIV